MSPQLQQLGPIERARLGPGGVQQRRGVSLRQHEAIAAGMLRILRVEPHLGEEQRGHEVGRRAAARGMAAARLGRRRTESIRSRVATFLSAGTSVERSMDRGPPGCRLQIVD